MSCRAMSYDETRYPKPEVFSPERFLYKQVLLIGNDPTELSFGFGQRADTGEQ